ncbi:MAG: group II intron reverse transcriptase/maturase [Chitinophagales bacterium]|nr:group II intron reverse transcriptase/maturase [Chitinophagales bacterium]
MLKEITHRQNLERAMLQVIRNSGSGGVDGMQTDELRDFLNTHYQQLTEEILTGSYQPSPVRKVEIPKAQGGTRVLGIPTVIDRLIQQAISQWLSPKYEATFSEQSYGFRPNRNAHQAVMQSKQYLQDGKTWVIEIDLEKFFDKVNHDRLMSTLAKRISDKSTLKLIRSYLSSGIMEGGIVSQRTEGTPQGSPLSPLLSNIVLDDLDQELTKRGHSFVRYADDCSIYVKSEKAAQRVCASITKYIEEKLLLKVSATKTKISRPHQSTLLGFSFYKQKGNWEIRIAEKSINRIIDKCTAVTQRSNGTSVAQKIAKLQPIILGWVNYFVVAKAKSTMQKLDERIRTRLRICKWKEWKCIKTKVTNLIKLGINRQKAYEWGNTSKGYCRVAHSPILCSTLNNNFFHKLGYIGFYTTFTRHPKMQPTLF